jgi:hypothetical protein
MRVITVEPSDKFMAGLEFLPGELFFYGKDTPLEKVQPLQKFLSRHNRYEQPSWQYDLRKAAKRLYPVLEAALGHRGLVVFIDPEFGFKKRITEDILRAELGRNYLGLYKRDGMPAKTDLYIMDGTNKDHDAYIDYVASILDSDAFQRLTHWTDGAILEDAAKQMDVKVKNLSGVFGKEKEPIRMTALAEYVDF